MNPYRQLAPAPPEPQTPWYSRLATWLDQTLCLHWNAYGCSYSYKKGVWTVIDRCPDCGLRKQVRP